MAKYPFLSDEWVAAAREIRQELNSGASSTDQGSSDQGIKMNQIVTEVPFGSGTINAHLDTSSGEPELELGHLDDADVTVTLDYATAKAILVEGNPQVAMQAYMGGKIRVDGDLGKLLMIVQAMASAPDPSAVAIARRIQAMTE